MADLPPIAHRVLVIVAPTREARDRVASALERRMRARALAGSGDRCTCPMSLRAESVHSLGCPCSVGVA
jgi:hypothetical protein